MEGSLFGYNKKCSFGTLEFDTTAEDPSVSYTIRNIDNEEMHKLTIFKSQLDFDPDKVRNRKGRK
jgi:alkaline phosphatase D